MLDGCKGEKSPGVSNAIVENLRRTLALVAGVTGTLNSSPIIPEGFEKGIDTDTTVRPTL